MLIKGDFDDDIIENANSLRMIYCRWPWSVHRCKGSTPYINNKGHIVFSRVINFKLFSIQNLQRLTFHISWKKVAGYKVTSADKIQLTTKASGRGANVNGKTLTSKSIKGNCTLKTFTYVHSEHVNMANFARVTRMYKDSLGWITGFAERRYMYILCKRNSFLINIVAY